MVYQDQLTLSTVGNGDLNNIEDSVREIVAASGISRGIVHVFNVGSTACVGTIEFEPGLQKDLPELLNKLMPAGRHYGHEQTWHDGNAHSHLQATLMGPSLSVPVRDGQPVLGTWQQVFHLECDIKPRNRTVIVTVMGDPE